MVLFLKYLKYFLVIEITQQDTKFTNILDQGCSTGGPGAGCGPPLQFLRPSRNFASLEFFILNFLPKQTDRLVTILTAML